MDPDTVSTDASTDLGLTTGGVEDRKTTETDRPCNAVVAQSDYAARLRVVFLLMIFCRVTCIHHVVSIMNVLHANTFKIIHG